MTESRLTAGSRRAMRWILVTSIAQASVLEHEASAETEAPPRRAPSARVAHPSGGERELPVKTLVMGRDVDFEDLAGEAPSADTDLDPRLELRTKTTLREDGSLAISTELVNPTPGTIGVTFGSRRVDEPYYQAGIVETQQLRRVTLRKAPTHPGNAGFPLVLPARRLSIPARSSVLFETTVSPAEYSYTGSPKAEFSWALHVSKQHARQGRGDFTLPERTGTVAASDNQVVSIRKGQSGELPQGLKIHFLGSHHKHGAGFSTGFAYLRISQGSREEKATFVIDRESAKPLATLVWGDWELLLLEHNYDESVRLEARRRAESR